MFGTYDVFDYIGWEEKRDPYVDFIRDDFHKRDSSIYFNADQDSITGRIWKSNENDFLRYFARKNPLGSEERFLEDVGERVGEAIYQAFEEYVSEADDVLLLDESGIRELRTDALPASRDVIRSLGEESEETYVRSALEAVEEKGFVEKAPEASEI